MPLWGLCGDSHRFSYWYGMGMGIEIESPRQPCSTNARIGSSIGASEIVRHDVKNTRIIFKLAKFYAHVD